jgi:hypothetical protein
MPLGISGDELNAIRDELVPHVEEVAGRRFTEIPPIAWQTGAAFARTLYLENAGLTLLASPEVPPEVVSLLGLGAEVAAPGVIAKYGLFDHALYVNQDGLRDVAAEVGAPAEAVIRCVVAHELAHALQAQEGVFERVAASRDLEWFAAMNLVAEGHALQVQEAVCARLGNASLAAPLRRIVGTDDAHSPYGLGLRFLAAHPDAWTVLRDPPADTAMVYFPERYRPGRPQPTPHRPALDAAARAVLGGRNPPVSHLRSGYADAIGGVPDDATALRAALAGLRGVWVSAAYAHPETATATLYTFDDEAAAQAYYSASHDIPAVSIPLEGFPVYARPPAPFAGVAQGYTVHASVRSTGGTFGIETQSWVAVQGTAVVRLEIVQAERRDAVVGPIAAALLAALRD